MYRKIDVFINGVYEFSTNHYRTCHDVVRHIREAKHLCITSLSHDRYITVYDYDKVVARYSK